MGNVFSRWVVPNTEDISAINSRLSFLDGVCIKEITERARVEKYGEGYKDFTSCKTWGESVLALGKACHVPNNNRETSEFEENIRGFVSEVVGRFLKKRRWGKSLHVTGHKIKLIGSFSSDTKVRICDEFDYVCVLKVPLRYFKLSYTMGRFVTVNPSVDVGKSSNTAQLSPN